MTYLQNTLGGNLLKDFKSKIGEKTLLQKNSISENTFLPNVIALYSALQLHWMILAFLFIVTLEALIIRLFLKDLKTSYYIAFISNLTSTIFAVPILLSPAGGHVNNSDLSSWLVPIIYGYKLFNPTVASIQVNFDAFFLFYIIAFVLTILIEYSITKWLILRNKEFREKYHHKKTNEFLKWTIIANSISYLVILFSLLLIGIGLTFVSTALNPFELLQSFFINSFGSTSQLGGLMEAVLYLFALLLFIPYYTIGFFLPNAINLYVQIHFYKLAIVFYLCFSAILLVLVYRHGNQSIDEKTEMPFSEIAQLVKHPINYFLFVFFASCIFGAVVSSYKMNDQIRSLLILLISIFISISFELIRKYQKRRLLTLELAFKIDRKSLVPLWVIIITISSFYGYNYYYTVVVAIIVAIVLTSLRFFLRESTEDISDIEITKQSIH
jgi:hypothetical protein